METIKIGSREFPIAGYIETEQTGLVPLVDLPMMSDYKWQLDCLNDCLEHPEKYQALGENVETVVANLRQWLEEHSGEAMS